MDPTTAATAGQQTPETPEAEEPGALSLQTFTGWLRECEEQPAWRAAADRCADYYDGNQLDSEILRRMQQVGMPPAIEPLIGPTIDAVLGQEAKSRTDWRVLPDSDKEGDEVAEALNYKLNQAERQAKADGACSDAYKSQVIAGLGWVEVARESDPFKYPYRATAVHRNEIWYDMLARPDLSNARYLIRRKWMDRQQAALLFPEHRELIESASCGWQGIDPAVLIAEGAGSTGLAMAWDQERGWSIEEQQWRDTQQRRVCLFEVWYRDFQRVLVLRAPDGRVVEYDPNNPAHVTAVGMGLLQPQSAILGKMRRAWWMGPHKLHDGPTPYRHQKFPYVPFFGKREDRTGTPYGLVRGMLFLQDEVNARIAKMQWGLAAIRTIRTEGAVLDDDDTFRSEIARPDADVVLDPAAMAQPGAVFKVERDFELNEQQYKRLVDAREGIKRTGGIYNAFMGQEEGKQKGQSGVAIAGLVEQANQTLAEINDNFKDGRAAVGDLLLALIIEDLAGIQQDVLIKGDAVKEDKTIAINVPAVDPHTGQPYLDNDVARVALKVVLSDVPSTPTFRTQQLAAMSEAFKSAPPEYQKVMMPYLFMLMDIPNRDDIIEAIRQADQAVSPEQIQQMIDEAVQQALLQAQTQLKLQELEQKQPLIDAQVKKTIAEAVAKGIEGFYSATNAAATIALQPAVAPLADDMLQSAGFVDQNAPPIIPAAPAGLAAVPPPTNTSPMFPPRTPSPAVGDDAGIEAGPSRAATPVTPATPPRK